MARSIRALLLAASIVAAGCGNTAPPTGDPGWPEPSAYLTNRLRDACWWLYVDEIESLIVAAQANADLGWSYGQSVLDIQGGCAQGCEGDQLCEMDCNTCGNAVVAAVYP